MTSSNSLLAEYLFQNNPAASVATLGVCHIIDLSPDLGHKLSQLRHHIFSFVPGK